MFLDYPKYPFLRVFLVFIMKQSLILTVLKQMVLDEIKQSNDIKPQKINFFMIFCKFLSDKGTFCRKVPSQNIFPFYYIYCIALLTFHQFQGNKKYEAAGRVLFIALKMVKSQKCYIICS